MEIIVVIVIICFLTGGSIGARLAVLHMYFTVFFSGFLSGIIISWLTFFPIKFERFHWIFIQRDVFGVFQELRTAFTPDGVDILIGISFGVLAIIFHKFSIVVITSLLGSVLISFAIGKLFLIPILFALGILYQYKILKYSSKKFIEKCPSSLKDDA